MIKVKRLTPTATVPTRAHKWDAGADLHCDTEGSICMPSQVAYPGMTTEISTGIAIAIPDNFVGLVMPRSGLAFRHGVDTMAGVIDPGYTGEVKVLITVVGERPLTIKHGDRIAQLLIVPVLNWTPEEVNELESSERGDNGFGSTGK